MSHEYVSFGMSTYYAPGKSYYLNIMFAIKLKLSNDLFKVRISTRNVVILVVTDFFGWYLCAIFTAVIRWELVYGGINSQNLL